MSYRRIYILQRRRQGDDLLIHIASLLVGGVLAGTVDTIVGGGGLFSVPTLFLVGLSPQAALGTNQFALSFGAMVGTAKFAQKRHIKWWPETILCAVGALPGTIFGGMTALALPPIILHSVVVVLLVVIGIFVLVKKNITDGVQRLYNSPSLWIRMLIFFMGVGIGFYEGFFGPGTGIIITACFVYFLGFSFLQASGTAKAISMLGNIVAFSTYAVHGEVRWSDGAIMAIAVSMGAYAGAFVAERGGRAIIRPVMMVVIVLLIVDVVASVIPRNIIGL